MQKKLYIVKYVSQETGKIRTEYILCKGLAVIEEEVADIVSIKPIKYEEIGD
jgi:hypothetical protein